jgi:hypothetical protein
MFASLYLGRLWFRQDARERAAEWFNRVRGFVLPPGPEAMVARFESLARGSLVTSRALEERPHLHALTRLELEGSTDEAAYAEAFREVPEAQHLIRAAGTTPVREVLRLEYFY